MKRKLDSYAVVAKVDKKILKELPYVCDVYPYGTKKKGQYFADFVGDTKKGAYMRAKAKRDYLNDSIYEHKHIIKKAVLIIDL